MNGKFSTTESRSVLVVGLGNPLLGDDGVGWRVAEQLQRDHGSAVEIDCLAVGGLRLMERLIGYNHVVIVDAVTTGQQPPGTLYLFSVAELPDTGRGHLSSVHDVTLKTALRLGAALGLSLPRDISIVGVEAEQSFDFAEELSPPVALAVPRAALMVIDLLRQTSEEEDWI